VSSHNRRAKSRFRSIRGAQATKTYFGSLAMVAEEPESHDAEDESDHGLSLEELGEAYAQMMQRGKAPYPTVSSGEEEEPEPTLIEPIVPGHDPLEEELQEDEDYLIAPRSIVEAALFVGHPENKPLTPEMLAGVMRGVHPAEVDVIVTELNQSYEAEGAAYRIHLVSGGYMMELAPHMHSLRDRFYGKVKEAKLNQAAVDILSLVAYQPGVERDKLEHQYGKPVGGILSQMVRRNLLEIRREGKGKTRRERYYPTQRFLALFQIDSLEDLPRVDDF
jgi:segregation and condensation protein B